MTSIAFLLLNLFAASVLQAQQIEVIEKLSPDGWNYELRKKSPVAYWSVTADFDGNGVVDKAQFFRNGNEFQVVAKLAATTSNSEFLLIDGPFAEVERYGIQRSLPGKYETAYSKGYGSGCEANPRSIEFPNTGIRFFAFESASQIFYWENGQFKSVAVTD